MTASSMIAPDERTSTVFTAYPVPEQRMHLVLHCDAGYTTWSLTGQQFEALRVVVADFAHGGQSVTRVVVSPTAVAESGVAA